MNDMISQIVFIPKLDREQFSGMELNAINGIKQAGDVLDVPVYSWQERQEQGPSDFTLYVSLGGDGTMLAAIRAAATEVGSSVLGINFGKLGFLTSIDGSKLLVESKFTDIIVSLSDTDKWDTDHRMVIRGNHRSVECDPFIAANEFLITTPTRQNPLQYDVVVNDNFVTSQSGDGVIVSTASGSTAYALSAGGAIMSPNSRAMQIVPLAVHTLTSRPIVVSENDKIEVIVDLTKQRASEVSVINDGNLSFIAHESDGEMKFTIRKNSFVTIWRPKGWNFFSVLSAKMKW